MSNFTKILLEKAVKTVKRKFLDEATLKNTPELTVSEYLKKWAEAKKREKIKKNLSNENVTELTGVSLATVGRIFSGGPIDDVRFSTVYSIDCLLPTSSEAEQSALSQLEILKIVEVFEKENAKVREDAAREIAIYKDKIAALEKQTEKLETLLTARDMFIDKLLKLMENFQIHKEV